MKRIFIYIFIILSLLSIDFSSKQYILKAIPLMSHSLPFYPYGGVGVFKGFLGGIDFSINHVVNKGGAWGIFSSYSTILLILRIFVISGLIFHLMFFNDKRERVVPFLLIISGALGNVIDCFLYGHVIDMFLFKFWGYFFPLFNIADSLIFLGIATLFLQMLFTKYAKITRKLSS